VGRPPHPLLSRDRIVSTALALADSAGLEAVSTRRLAAELGVAGPSLYNPLAFMFRRDGRRTIRAVGWPPHWDPRQGSNETPRAAFRSGTRR